MAKKASQVRELSAEESGAVERLRAVQADEVAAEWVHPFDYQTQKRAGRNISAASQGKGNNAQSPVGHGKGLAYPSNVLTFKEGAGVTGHAAAFPVRLPAFFIRAFSDIGDVVYDPFMGSGTTLMAAQQLDRTGAGAELSPTYCDLIVERWQNLTGQKAQRQSAG